MEYIYTPEGVILYLYAYCILDVRISVITEKLLGRMGCLTFPMNMDPG